jgi:hypothetical protein
MAKIRKIITKKIEKFVQKSTFLFITNLGNRKESGSQENKVLKLIFFYKNSYLGVI